MKAYYYYDKAQKELKKALTNAYPDMRSTVSTSKDIEEINSFFEESKKMEYNDFLDIYNERYGNIIKQYRENQKVKAIITIKVAAILYIITFILGVIGVIVYLAQSSGSSY